MVPGIVVGFLGVGGAQYSAAVSSRARVVLGGVGAGVSTLALFADLAFLMLHNAHLHFDIHVLLGLAGLLVGFTALGLSLALVLQGRAAAGAGRQARSVQAAGGARDGVP